MDFFILGVVYYFDLFLFMFFYYIFIFGGLLDYSWHGRFIYCESFIYVLMVYMCFFILLLVVRLEKNYSLLFLSQLLVLVSILFFFSSNLVSLYVFYELSLFPILIMLVGYGSQVEKIGAGYYLLFYTIFCSFPYLYVFFSSSSYLFFVYFDIFLSWEIFFLLRLSFIVKFPVYFLHLWLPKAHVEAPTSASIILAGLLLKLGCVGFIRIMKGLSYCNSFFWLVLAVLGMVLCSLSCIMQSDVKSLAAYSSVVHISMFMFLLVGFDLVGKRSGILILFCHGITSVLMFYLIGEFYYKVSRRLIYYFSGFFGGVSIFYLVFVFVFLSNLGVPLSLSFFGEFAFVFSFFGIYFFGFLIIGLYLFFSFYYSIYVIGSGLIGSSGFVFEVFNVCLCFPFVLMTYNFFLFFIIY